MGPDAAVADMHGIVVYSSIAVDDAAGTGYGASGASAESADLTSGGYGEWAAYGGLSGALDGYTATTWTAGGSE